VIRHHPRARRARVEHRGQIRISEERLRVGAQRVVVDRLQQARRTVTSAHREDPTHDRVAQRAVEIGDALRVGSGKKPASSKYVFAEAHAQPERFDAGDREVELGRRRERSGWRDQGDGIAGTQSGRTDHDFNNATRSG